MYANKSSTESSPGWIYICINKLCYEATLRFPDRVILFCKKRRGQMRDTAVGEGRLKSGTTVRGRQFGNCSRNGSETGAKESGWIPKQGASVRREPWKFKTHMTAHHPLADRRLVTFISCPAKFWSLLPTTHMDHPSIQYSVFPGLPQTLDLTSCPRCLWGKERTPGLLGEAEVVILAGVL